jgi:predicted Zn-dependent protease with MMP-like domain
MDREQFEQIVEEEFERVPDLFRTKLENVRIVVEEEPHQQQKGGRGILLGLYQGIPLNKRGNDYGVYPVVPDTITLYRKNIQSIAADDDDIRRQVRVTLIHEIGHYYGMSEADIRRAGY